MNKEIKKAAALLDAKEKEKAAAIAKAEKEITETKAKLTELKTQLNKGETAEEYKRLLSEIRDNEAVISFFEKKKKDAEAQGLTSAEYSEIVQDIKASAETIREDTRAAIVAEIDKLTSLLMVYDANISELNKVLARAAQVRKLNNPYIIDAQALTAGDNEHHYYIEAFYRTKNARELLKRGIKA